MKIKYNLFHNVRAQINSLKLSNSLKFRVIVKFSSELNNLTQKARKVNIPFYEIQCFEFFLSVLSISWK